MGQRNSKKKPDSKQVEINLEESFSETTSTTDLVETVDLLIGTQEYVLVENYWANVNLKEDPVSYITQEMEKMKDPKYQMSNAEKLKECVKKCDIFLNSKERDQFRKAISIVVLYGQYLTRIGKLGVELFQDIILKVNEDSYEKRFKQIYTLLCEKIQDSEFITELETSISFIETTLSTKAKKYFWACVILGVVSLVGLVGLGVAAITTFIGAFVGIPIVAGVGVAAAVVCSVAIPMTMNASYSYGETSDLSSKWEDKFHKCSAIHKKIIDSDDFTSADKGIKNFDYGHHLPSNEECEGLIKNFTQLTLFGNHLINCVI